MINSDQMWQEAILARKKLTSEPKVENYTTAIMATEYGINSMSFGKGGSRTVQDADIQFSAAFLSPPLVQFSLKSVQTVQTIIAVNHDTWSGCSVSLVPNSVKSSGFSVKVDTNDPSTRIVFVEISWMAQGQMPIRNTSRASRKRK